MRLIQHTLAAASLLFMGMCAPAFAGFLRFPLHGCADAAGTANYIAHGAYTANALNSILDHHMKRNSTNSYPNGITPSRLTQVREIGKSSGPTRRLNRPADHRTIKRVTRPMLGFKSFRSARTILAGIELQLDAITLRP